MSVYTKYVVASLFVAFLIQPIAPTYANEPDEAESVTVEEVAEEPESELVPEPVSVDDAATETEKPDEGADEAKETDSTETEEETLVAEDEFGTSAAITESTQSTTTSAKASSTLETTSRSTTTAPTASTTDETASTSIPVTGGGGGGDTAAATTSTSTGSTHRSASTTDSTAEKEVFDATEPSLADTGEPELVIDTSENDENETASTSEPETSVAPAEATVHFSDTNKYQFGSTECVSVGDGSYYCSESEDTQAKDVDDRLFVSKDTDGDNEIYIRIKGATKQLSHNLLEDAAPHYDPLSQSVVWHRLVDGRYQIISYNLDDEEETMLTDNDTNDMEPTRAGEYTVWQRWIDNNWEVMLFDGVQELQLTENSFHDVAPSVRGEFVIWHTSNGSERNVVVYEIATGLISTISDSEGGNVQNPRFVLVYDTTFDNGDVVTKGYDFESGEITPLSAIPSELPDEIPTSDSTGETRALIQNKSTNSKEEIVTVPSTGTTTSPTSTSTGTSTAPATVSENDVTEATSTPEVGEGAATTTEAAVIDMSPEEEPFELTEFDVIVLPYEGSSTTDDSTQTVDSETGTSSVE